MFTTKGTHSNLEKQWSPSWAGRASVHVVFSTDCGSFQDWQSRVLFDSARQVGHVGPITRIASGCSDPQMAKLANLMQTDRFFAYAGGAAAGAVNGPGDSWFVHFTPHFSRDRKTGKDYKFYNKPRGILHWLQHGRGGAGLAGRRPIRHGSNATQQQQQQQQQQASEFLAGDVEDPPGVWPDVIALVDPDEMFLRPFDLWVGNSSNLLVTNPVKRDDKLLPRGVERGRPAGQFYGLGDKWRSFNRPYICGAPDSPCVGVESGEAWRYYSVGPPYVAHVADWRLIAASWVDFVPRVYEEYPNLLAEMYAYCLAAAHHGLRHARVDHYMVSNVGSYGEAWPHVDAMSSVCAPGLPLFWSRDSAARLPAFLHACQGYNAGRGASFSKRRVQHGIFDGCSGPLLPEPGEDLVTQASQAEVAAVAAERAKKRRKLTDPEQRALKRKRDAFMVCTASKYVNAAVRTHRRLHCPESEEASS